jgi:hypothetical protein
MINLLLVPRNVVCEVVHKSANRYGKQRMVDLTRGAECSRIAPRVCEQLVKKINKRVVAGTEKVSEPK